MASPQRLETVRRIQTAMATGYTTLGAWALLHPASIFALGFRPPFDSTITATGSLFCRCWGAQAMTCGVLLGTALMSPRSFRAFAAAMLPYIAWNFWGGLGPGRAMMTCFIWLDFLGNVFFLGGSLWCAKLLEEEAAGVKGKGL